MGTPEFAKESLKIIVEEGFNVAAVVTAPDKPSGRGRKLQQSAVKKFALENDLPVLQPSNLKDPDFLSSLIKLKADLIAVVAFRMLPEVIWSMPQKGTINLHASLLPDYRGAAPINWVIMNGEKKTGITTFFIEKDIDTGNILLQEEVDIPETLNAGELHDRLMRKGGSLLVKTIEKIISRKIKSVPQKKNIRYKLAPKIYPQDCEIDWKNDFKSIYNQIRGLSPYPGAWTMIQTENDKNFTLKIFSAEYKSKSNDILEPIILNDSNLSFSVKVPGGILNILELQVPGKKKMNIQEFLRGNSIEGWKLL